MPQDREDSLREIDDLLLAAARINRRFPEAVLVGGTATAVHARHRLSNDADFVLPGLSERFDEIFAVMDGDDGWNLARAKPPVVIMGNFHGVETTLRQLIRHRPLETEEVETPEGPARVPTLDEMIRVKAWLALTRNAYRDYLDLAALSEVAGLERTGAVLAGLDAYYADVDRKGVVRGVSPALQLARQLFEPAPHDVAKNGEVDRYKAVSDQWRDHKDVLSRCRDVGFALASRLFEAEPAPEDDLETISKARDRDCSEAEAPDFPGDTHEARRSRDGTVIVIRTKEFPGPAKVDNPLGPAVVTPEGARYALGGRFMPEETWRQESRPPAGPAR